MCLLLIPSTTRENCIRLGHIFAIDADVKTCLTVLQIVCFRILGKTVLVSTEEEIPASRLKNYYKSVSEHKDITKLLMVLTSVISSTKAEVMTCLDSFTQFHAVWDEDKEKAVAVSVFYALSGLAGRIGHIHS